MTFAEQLAHHLTLRPPMPDASDTSVPLSEWIQARKALEVWLEHRDRLAVRVKCPEMFPAPFDVQYTPPSPPKAHERRSSTKTPQNPVRPWNRDKGDRP